MPDEPRIVSTSGAPPPDFQRLREDARRSLLRANTAVALVLVVVFALALAAVWLGWRATELRREAESNQRRAEQAEAKARTDLWRAYVSEARATRLGNTLERRAAALDSIRRAATIVSAPELRNEAVATLALPDFQLESSVYLAGASGFALDPLLRRGAFAQTNGDVVVRTFNDGREVARFRKADGEIPDEQGAAGNAMEFSPDGKRLSVRYSSGAFAIWDVDSGRVLFRHDIDQPRRMASTAHFSSDSRYVVAPVFSPEDGMAVFDIDTGQSVAFFPEFSSYRHSAVRPGAPMFVANTGSNVVVVNWETKERVAEFSFEGGARRLAWTPDGQELVIAGNLLEVHVWNLAQHRRRVFSGHKGDVWGVAFNRTGTRMATSSEDGISRIWDMRTGDLVGMTAEGYIMQWGDGDRIGWLRPKTAFEIRQLSQSPVYHTLPGQAMAADAQTMDISPDGRWAVSRSDARGLLVWNLDKPNTPETVALEGVRSLCFHPTEPRLFITKSGGPHAYSYFVVTNAGRASFRLGEPIKLPVVPNTRVNLITISANGQALGYVELAAGRAWAQQLGGNQKPVWIKEAAHSSVAEQSSSARGAGTIALSPDGRWFVCGYGARGAEIHDARTGQSVARLTTHQGNVQFSPDGKWVVVAETEFCRLFRATDWSQAWQAPSAPHFTIAGTAAFSPDSSMVAVAKSARSAALLDVATGRELAVLEGPAPSPIVAIRWTADGRRIVFSTRENHLDVWDAPALQRELSSLGLPWNSSLNGLAAITPGLGAPASQTSAAWIAAGAFATVTLVAIVAVLSLRRHRKLIDDFTRTEALAAQRERELEGEREVNRLKSNFVSMVSHEFRTPLAIIQSSAQILDRYHERLPEEQRREEVGTITRNVRRVTELIDEVLLLGKVEAGQMRCAPRPMDLAEFCRRLTDEIHSATDRRCQIHLELEPGLTQAHGDENVLRQLIGNLLSNAVKYSTPGQPVVFNVSRHQAQAVFVVRDAGIGIPEADRAKLFTAFHRASNVGQIRGTGLGLTIVKRCVDLHGGQISFTTAEGKGTTFTVSVPLFTNSRTRPL